MFSELPFSRVNPHTAPGDSFKTKSRVGSVAQVIECLPGKHKVLSSNPTIAEKKIKPIIQISL
jgi:hypothetical protein